MVDIPLTMIGGKGAHGLALHIILQERGIHEYRLLDPANDWLSLYGPQGPMQAMGHLRSPHELDFSLGDTRRSMRVFRDTDGSQPLANVYSLSQAEDASFNEHTDTSVRAPRAAFWRYANHLAKDARGDAYVLAQKVRNLVPKQGTQADYWQVELEDGSSFSTRVILLATGLLPHLYIPQPWQAWWQRLPAGQMHHAFQVDYQAQEFVGKKVALIGSSNIATWEAAIKLAKQGARVTLLSRYTNPIERQLPMPPFWLQRDFIEYFMHLPWKERKQRLKRPHIPASALPGMAQQAYDAGVTAVHHARVHYASPLWGGIQLLYKQKQQHCAEYFDHIIAATGASPNLRELPFLRQSIEMAKPPTSVERVVRHRPILDAKGRWKNLPPLYPLGSHALMRAGHAANTLASAGQYLPLLIDDVLEDAGLKNPSHQSNLKEEMNFALAS